MDRKVRSFDFTKPDEARLFLSGLRVRHQKITGINLSTGKWVEFSELKDDEATYYASMVYRDLIEDQPKTLLRWDDEALN